jgi:hypothetical protein
MGPDRLGTTGIGEMCDRRGSDGRRTDAMNCRVVDWHDGIDVISMCIPGDVQLQRTRSSGLHVTFIALGFTF